MILIDAFWAVLVNILAIRCEECKIDFAWFSNISLVECPSCHVREYWHGGDPSMWDERFKTMKNNIKGE